jgi:hypothetical protein
MTMKTLLLGAAAGLMTVGAAQAADLPMTKAEAVEYVKVCTEFGEGYFYIPGTDTCLRLQGEVRAFYRFNQVKDTATSNKRDQNATNFSSQARVMWDARTQTEYGLLRSYFQINATADNGAFNFEIDKAFIQFGGLTAGYAHSFFGIYDNDYGNTIFAGYYTSQSTVNLLAYTAQFGGGFSATLSVEDNIEHRSALWDSTINVDVSGGFPLPIEIDASWGTAGTYGGSRFPDIVANLRLDQGWGEAAIFGAGHQVNYPSGVNNKDDWGWAAGAGVGVKLPFLAGAHIALEGVYAEGANNYLGLSSTPEANYVANSFLNDTELGKGWSVTGEFGVDVSPSLTVNAFGSYVDYTAGDVFNLDGTFLHLPAVDDFKAWVAGINATYTVVKGLTVSAEVYYQKKDYDEFGTDGVPSNVHIEFPPLSVTTGGTVAADTSSWNGGIRIRRTF